MCPPADARLHALSSVLTTARAQRQLPAALELYGEMQARGPTPTVVTYNVLLSACAAQADGNTATRVADDLRESGVQTDAKTAAALAAALPCLDDAFAAVERVERSGVELNEYVMSALISACGRAGDWRRAAHVFHERASTSHMQPSLVIVNAFVDACAKCAAKDGGAIAAAIEVVDGLEDSFLKPDVVTLTSLVATYGAAGMLYEAAEVMEEAMPAAGVRPNVFSYVTLISCCVDHGEWQEGVRWYAAMRKAGVKPNAHAFSALVSAYACGQQLERALCVPDEMARAGVRPNVVVYNCLVDACASAGDWEKGLALWMEMRATGIAPNERTYLSLITACEEGGEWRRALSVFEEMRSSGLSANVYHYSSLIAALGKGGQFERANEFYLDMRAQGVAPNAVCFGALLDAAAEQGDSHAALRIYRELEEAKVRPNVVVLNSLLRALCGAGCWTDAEAVLARFREDGVTPDTVSWNTMISASESEQRAFELFKRAEAERASFDVVSYNALIHACEDVDRAFGVFERMLASGGVAPDAYTYNTLIALAGKAGDVQQALQVTVWMRAAGLQPTDVTYSSLLDALWHGGRQRACAHLVRRLRAQGKGVGQVLFEAREDGGVTGALDLHHLSPGGAQALTLVWLVDECATMLNDGSATEDAVAHRVDRVAIVTGRRGGTSVLRAQVTAMLQELQSPFVAPAGNDGRLEGEAEEVARWLTASAAALRQLLQEEDEGEAEGADEAVIQSKTD